jgi:hypothetical protein
MATDGRAKSSLAQWLGRQIGYVKAAIRADVSTTRVVGRRVTSEAKPVSRGITARRTVIDELIVEKK